MRYQLELEINAPRDRVVELFLDPDNLKKWQPDLVSIEIVGDKPPREVGGQTRQIHRMGKREMEILETITVYQPPRAFAATYESDGVWNLVENQLTELNDKQTHWVLTSEFKCSNWLMKIFTVVMPGMFKKQTMTFMQRFKEFVERKAA